MLTVNDLTKSFGSGSNKLEVLKGVDMTITKGEMGEPSEQLAEMQALLREVKQRSALRVLGAVIGMWSHAKTVQMVEKSI